CNCLVFDRACLYDNFHDWRMRCFSRRGHVMRETDWSWENQIEREDAHKTARLLIDGKPLIPDEIFDDVADLRESEAKEQGSGKYDDQEAKALQAAQERGC